MKASAVAGGHDDSQARGDMGRLEAFSDGVFGIAMTLLILELKVPRENIALSADLWRALGHEWPSYLALSISFATVLVMWVNHHGIFSMVHHSNARFMFANGFLLFLVTVVPFPTALLAAYLTEPAGEAAVATYCGFYVVMSVAYSLLWYTAWRGKLLVAHISAKHARTLQLKIASGLPVYGVAMGMAFVNVYVSIGICSILWIVWARMSYEEPK